jgi:hypothetical protein
MTSLLVDVHEAWKVPDVTYTTRIKKFGRFEGAVRAGSGQQR